MLFSSVIFIYLFLPITILGYYLLPKAAKNYWLLAASLLFFAWGGVSYTIILVVSIIINYVFGLQIEKHLGTPKSYRWLFVGVTINLVILGVFKYTNFIVENINQISGAFSNKQLLTPTEIILPVGISFYTFHSLSYLIDIYRRKSAAQKNIFDLSLYICMFSQLIAGPIIRYSDIWQQLRGRVHNINLFSSGIERFLIGLAKKVLLANIFAHIADTTFAANPDDLGALNAWLGIICYTLQIYCDFAGYSDMAIGLGRMFGFEFKENFNYPYIATSVKEFWRRWHISLSSFFRDYVYIPLGGNKVGTGRTYFNLVTVFFLTGFWHGASWTFVVWGLFHGFFMVLERLGLEKLLAHLWKPLSILYTLLVVIFAWVLFRVNTLKDGVYYWKAMLTFSTSHKQIVLFLNNLDSEFYIALAITLIGMFGGFKFIINICNYCTSSKSIFHKGFSFIYYTCSILFYLSILLVCSTYLIAGTYNPFIYYRF